MACTLTIVFSTPGYGSGEESIIYSVPDSSYDSPYQIYRPDLGYNGDDNNSYSVDCNGSQGVIRLATYEPGSIKVSIKSFNIVCDSPKYDCVNAECIQAEIYKTPGIYQSLEECQLSCGKGCSGVCISSKDWARIESLSKQVKNKNCS